MVNTVLLRVLAQPRTLLRLSLKEWDTLLPLARYAGVLGKFQPWLARRQALPDVPSRVLPHLESARILADDRARRIQWEVNRLRRALADTGLPLILLKGAAYHLAELPCASGRLAADVDILVSKGRLADVEAALRGHGWLPVKLDDYDQQYYRRWMHELPPMRHRLRGTEVDIHHTLLPTTARLTPDPAALMAAVVPTREPGVYVPCPADMILHSAAHAFYDGDFDKGLRDLVDIHELLEHFGATPTFWEELPRRAKHMDLERPLFYALRYARRLLHTPLPESVDAILDTAGPNRPVRWLMDRLVIRALLAGPEPTPTDALAGWLLYVRSHWLRMPPLLLARHLLHKALRRTRLGTAANQTGA